MRYCVIGAGAVGGALAAFLLRAGLTCDIIARGKTMEILKNHGISLQKSGETQIVPCARVCDSERYNERPDVIFVAVKGYSLESIVPVLSRVCTEDTVVIPLLNIYGTGAVLQEKLPKPLVTDGCIYIAASSPRPGTVEMQGDIFRVVYGVRERTQMRLALQAVAEDLKQAGITPVLSPNIRRDTLKKYAYTSPMAAAGLYFDADAERFQKEGEERALFVSLMREIDALAKAMGTPFDVDIVKTNLTILDALSPNASTSMQRDLRAGKPSEIDGLLFEPVRLGKRYGVPTPQYRKIAEHFGFSE